MAQKDQYGVEFSDDGKKLIKCPYKLDGGRIPEDEIFKLNDFLK